MFQFDIPAAIRTPPVKEFVSVDSALYIVHAQIRGSDGHKSVMQCAGWLSNIKITRDLVARNINISFCQHDQAQGTMEGSICTVKETYFSRRCGFFRLET